MIPKDGTAKQLKIFSRRKHISTWVFFPNLMLCFRQSPNNGKQVKCISYERGLNICRRILTTAQNDPTIQVKGSMIDELQKENNITNLLKGEKKIVLGVE